MNIKKTVVFISALCFFGSTIPFNQTIANTKDSFLEIVSVSGQTPDPRSFSIPQNIFQYSSGQINLFSTNQPYFHQGLVLDPYGYIYFCDKGNAEIEVYDFAGNPIRTIGSVGNNGGQFQILSDVCIDSNGAIYALDSFLNNVQIFNRDGTFKKEFSLSLSSDDNKTYPMMMTLSNDENLFIIDVKNGGKVFSKEGKWIKNLENNFDKNYSDTIFHSASDICTDEEGNVYILNNLETDGAPFFMIFGPDGKILHRELIPLSYGEDERTRNFCPSFTYYEGKFYLTILKEPSSTTSYNFSCLEIIFQKIKSKLDDIYQVESKIYIEDLTGLPIAIFKTKNNLITLDSSTNRMFFYDKSGKVTKEVDSTIKSQMFQKPSFISYDIDENLYVCDPKNNRVSAMNFIKNEVSFIDQSIPSPFYKKYYDKGPWEPSIVQKDSKGNFYIYDELYKEIHILDTQKKPIQILSPNHSDVIAFDFDAEGKLYILSLNGSFFGGYSQMIDVYNDLGSTDKIRKIQTITIKDQFALDMTTDSEGNIYLSCIDKVLVYSKDGRKIDEWLFSDLLISKIFHTNDNITYILSNSKLIKVDLNGKILYQQNLDWFHISDITGNDKGEIYLADDFHGLIITLKDTTYVQNTKESPLLLSYVPNETYFNRLLIQGRTSPETIVNIQNIVTRSKSDGTFAEYVSLDYSSNSNQITITAKKDECKEKIKKVKVKRLSEIKQTFTISGFDGKDGKPFIDKETKRTYVPFRRISEETGAVVKWDSKTQMITVIFPEVKIETIIGHPKARVNGKVSYMDPEYKNKVYVKVINNTTFIPLRFFSESYGSSVSWDAKNNQIIVVYPNQTFKTPEIVDPPDDFDDSEWLKQYGISGGDYSKLISTQGRNISTLSFCSKKEGNIWLLNVDQSGKPLQSILYQFPYQPGNPISIFSNPNKTMSIFTPILKNNINTLNLSKEPLEINYFTIDQKGMILNSNFLILQSNKKMFVSYQETFPLSRGRFLINYSVFIEGQDSKSYEGFSLIDSSGKNIESFLLEINEEKYSITTSVHALRNDKFALLIIKKYRNDLTEMEIIGFTEVGNIDFKVSLPAVSENYSYPSFISCESGFLIMTKINEFQINFAKFSDRGATLWTKEMHLNEKDLSITSIQESIKGEFCVFITRKNTKSTSFQNYIVRLSKEGNLKITFSFFSKNYAYFLKTVTLEDESEIIIGNQALRNFADSNVMILKWNLQKLKYRFYQSARDFATIKDMKLTFKNGETKISKIKIPITIKVKNLEIPFKEAHSDFQ